MKKYGSDWNIVYLGKKKILDIEEASIEELQEAEEEVTRKLKRLYKMKNVSEKISNVAFVPFHLATVAFIYLAGRHLSANIIGNSYVTDAGIGILSIFAALGINDALEEIPEFIYGDADHLISTAKKIVDQKNVMIARRNGTQELEEMVKGLTEGIELSENKKPLKQKIIKGLLKDGASPKLVNAPVIQNLINYELSKPASKRRGFSYSPKGYDTYDAVKNYYEIIKDPTESFYYIIEFPAPYDWCLRDHQKIFLNKDGNILWMRKHVKMLGDEILPHSVDVYAEPKKTQSKNAKKKTYKKN